MIIEEFIEEGRRVYHYSDQKMMLLQNETGLLYEDAVDVVPCRYTYSETDTPIPDHEDPNAHEPEVGEPERV